MRRKSDPIEIKTLHPSVKEQPTGCTLILLRGTRNAVWFDEFKAADPCQRQWRPRFGAKHTLEADGSLFRLTAANGHVWEFHAFTPNCFETSHTELYKNQDSRLDGRLIRHIAPGGQALVASYTDGRLEKVERQGAGTTERFEYKYYDQGDNCGRLRRVTWIRERKLRRAEYTYYEQGELYGNLGDLKTARTLVWTDDGWRQRKNSVQYFRYETDPTDTYCQGLLQCVVGPEAFHRMIEKGLNPFRASDAEIHNFADLTCLMLFWIHRGGARFPLRHPPSPIQSLPRFAPTFHESSRASRNNVPNECSGPIVYPDQEMVIHLGYMIGFPATR